MYRNFVLDQVSFSIPSSCIMALFPVLFFFAAENTCSDEPQLPAGTGLSNIKAVVEKYHGALQNEKNGRQFYLRVLLHISPCDL